MPTDSAEIFLQEEISLRSIEMFSFDASTTADGGRAERLGNSRWNLKMNELEFEVRFAGFDLRRFF